MKTCHAILRRAQASDCEVYWLLANDPCVRFMAFNQQSIPWQNHQDWFLSRLASPHSHLFVLDDPSGTSIGQVRFDEIEEQVFEVDISVFSNYRKQGYGRVLLRQGEELLRKYASVKNLRALIKPANKSSIALFESSGYGKRSTSMSDTGCDAFVLEKL